MSTCVGIPSFTCRQDKTEEHFQVGNLYSQFYPAVVNNLIVKFVEDDIVLSVNVKSVEYHSVNSIWQKSFIDLTPEDLVRQIHPSLLTPSGNQGFMILLTAKVSFLPRSYDDSCLYRI